MISVQAAGQIILSTVRAVPTEEVPLTEATGKVLREPLYADRDFPPFQRVMMDGVAVAFSQIKSGRRSFAVTGAQFAGMPPQTLSHPEACLEVMTGAVLPIGTDTVIRYEDLTWEEKEGVRYARVTVPPEHKWLNVHQQGTDQTRGNLLTPTGTILGPAEIGVAASVGKFRLRVSQPLRIALLSTGDELVDVHQTPLPHQIRRSNVYMLQAALQAEGALCQLYHVPDDKAIIGQTLTEVLAGYDCLALSGGVSMGKSDFVPEVLEALGVQKLFHQVAQKPGKPFWFGRIAAGKTVFAFPGNPVSTFLCCYRYLLPWLRACTQAGPKPIERAVLAGSIQFKPALTYFVPVRTESNPAGMVVATPLPGSGSGDFANLLQADAFLELTSTQQQFNPGEVFPLIRFGK